MTRYLGVFAVLALAVASSAASATPPQQIAFTRDSSIYVMNADGANVQQLTSTWPDADPSWSPDGSQLAFVSRRNGLYDELYVMNADGSGARLVVDKPAETPSWSRQGVIAFASGGIATVNPDGTGLKQVTTNGTDPSWSPDGTKIAYGATVNGFDTIFIVNADGSGAHAIAPGHTPSFSPDGAHLAWGSMNGSLVVANADGSSPQTIYTPPHPWTYDLYPAWSLDSQRIVFDEGPNAELWSVGLGGGTPTQLTSSPAVDTNASWRPAVPSTGLAVAQVRFTQRACATRPGKATVTVVDAQGRPLAGARVTLTGVAATTGADGAASIVPKVAKRHRGRLYFAVSAALPGRSTVTKHLSLPACA